MFAANNGETPSMQLVAWIGGKVPATWLARSCTCIQASACATSGANILLVHKDAKKIYLHKDPVPFIIVYADGMKSLVNYKR